MIPRLSRPLVKHWSEVPLLLGLLVFLGVIVKQCAIYWATIQRMGGLAESIRTFFGE